MKWIGCFCNVNNLNVIYIRCIIFQNIIKSYFKFFICTYSIIFVRYHINLKEIPKLQK